MKDELIRDRLVVGILDKRVSQQLQTDSGLMVEKAKTTIRQKAAILEQGQELESDKKRESLEELEKSMAELQASMDELKQQPRFSRRGRRTGRRTSANFKLRTATCSRCGYEPHGVGETCPAAAAFCHRCHKQGHISLQCFSKVPAKPSSVDYTFLDAVVNNGEKKDTLSWMTIVSLEQQEVDFKVDTGAAVTASTEQTYLKLGTSPLSRPSRILCGPAQNCLEVQGVFKGQFAFQGRMQRKMSILLKV